MLVTLLQTSQLAYDYELYLSALALPEEKQKVYFLTLRALLLAFKARSLRQEAEVH